MALLNNRLTKEGPGVYLDDPPKGAVALFFSILGRKFWKIGTINLMYILFSLPIIALVFLITPFLVGNLFPGLTSESIQQYLVQSGIAANMGADVTLSSYTSGIVVSLYTVYTVFIISMSLIVLGPIHAGMTYLLRNYAREQHAFVWSDFWEHAKKNLGQSLASSLLSLVVTVVLTVSLGVYRQMIGSGFLRVIVTGLFLLFFLIFAVMQMYVYPMMVTFKLSLKNIYKNAFLFFTLKLFPNIGIILICIALSVALPVVLILFLNQFGMLLYLAYYGLIGLGIQYLLVNFYVFRQLDRFMLQRMDEDGNKIEEKEETDEVETDQ